MPTPRPAAAESDNRERILHVAAEIFAAGGLAGARVDDIAAKARINKAMIYYYFGDKDSLYAAVFLQTLEEARTRLDQAVAAESTPQRRFRAVVQAMAEMAAGNPHFAPLMLREIASGGATLPPAVLRQMDRVFRIIAEVLDQGAERRVFRAVEPMTMHMLVGGSLLVLIAGAPIRRRIRSLRGGPESAVADRSAAAIAEYVADLLLNGLCRRGAERRAPRRKRPAEEVS